MRPIRLPRLFPVMVLGCLPTSTHSAWGELLRSYLVRAAAKRCPSIASLASIGGAMG